MSRTPSPWYVIPNPDWSGANARIDSHPNAPWGNFGQIAYASADNARFIVTACNAHDALVEALEALILSWENIDYHDWQEQIGRAKAALALAKAQR